MSRILKEEEYATRRNEIIDAALRLVYTKGYEKMTIQDILDDLKISKGAFYHYFGSKQAMLEGLIERIQEEIQQLLAPVIQDPHLSALEKLSRFFATATGWKIAHKNLILALLRVWYADDNAIVRRKTYTSAVNVITPLLSEICRQGVQEGVFTTSYPDKVGEVLLCLLQGMGDKLGSLLLSYEPGRFDFRIESAIAVYDDAMERVLGAPTGCISLMITEAMKDWFSQSEKAVNNFESE